MYFYSQDNSSYQWKMGKYCFKGHKVQADWAANIPSNYCHRMPGHLNLSLCCFWNWMVKSWESQMNLFSKFLCFSRDLNRPLNCMKGRYIEMSRLSEGFFLKVGMVNIFLWFLLKTSHILQTTKWQLKVTHDLTTVNVYCILLQGERNTEKTMRMGGHL